MPDRYRSLNPAKLVETLHKLQSRIDERFPESGLSRVCAKVEQEARAVVRRAEVLARPNWVLRIGITILVAAGIAAQIAAARFMHFDHIEGEADLIQSLEAAVNLLILFGAAVWFLLSLEERMKRRRVLDGLHALRSLAHVVDMHQLTKDPTLVLTPLLRTQASPARSMSRFELTRYLDYCAEMLALIGKLAALYAERVRDPVVIDAVNDIENLAANLGRKIWQKIMILGALSDGDEKPSMTPPA
jgi:hypothetical protein